MRVIFATVLLFLFLVAPGDARAGEPVVYHDGDTALEGYWEPSACPDAPHAPVVMIVHQWMGLTGYEKMRAGMLAKECYNAFAVDMYGQGIRPENKADAGKQAKIYKSDAALARRRIKAALDYALSRNDADTTRIAAIGYCFGGSMVLELARSGARISGIAGFHGGLSSPDPVKDKDAVKTPLTIYHGDADPNVPKEEIDAFIDEMVKAKAIFSLTRYEGAVHAFTQKDAGDDPSAGVAYNQEADEKSWASLLYFLEDVFTKKKND